MYEEQSRPFLWIQISLTDMADKVVFVLSLTGELLNALLSGLSDRSASVRKSYATAIGHLVKVRSDKPSSSHYMYVLDFYAIS